MKEENKRWRIGERKRDRRLTERASVGAGQDHQPTKKQKSEIITGIAKAEVPSFSPPKNKFTLVLLFLLFHEFFFRCSVQFGHPIGS